MWVPGGLACCTVLRYCLLTLSVQLGLFQPFDCSSDKSVSSGITSAFFTRSQMRLLFFFPPLIVLFVPMLVLLQNCDIICSSYESSVFFTLSSFLSVSFSSAFKACEIFLHGHTLTHADTHAPRYSQGLGFFSPGNTLSLRPSGDERCAWITTFCRRSAEYQRQVWGFFF